MRTCRGNERKNCEPLRLTSQYTPTCSRGIDGCWGHRMAHLVDVSKSISYPVNYPIQQACQWSHHHGRPRAVLNKLCAVCRCMFRALCGGQRKTQGVLLPYLLPCSMDTVSNCIYSKPGSQQIPETLPTPSPRVPGLQVCVPTGLFT